MKNIDFIIQRDRVLRNYIKELNIDNNESLYGQYTMVSASLSNFLPEINPKRHLHIFMQLLIHKRLSKFEQGTEEALTYLTTENLEDESLEYLKRNPAIICTFHTGSYRIINSFLVKSNIPYTLVIGKSIIEQEGQDYHSLFQTLSNDNRENYFKIIDAEDASSGCKMLKELKRGRVLLLYLDGNSGVGATTTRNDNSCIIEFLHQQIYARTGIGFLAHAARVPIFPVINYRVSLNDVRLQFCDAIWPGNEDREIFCKTVTQRLYDIAALIIRKYPEQWEGWLYIHKVANIYKPFVPEKSKKIGELLHFNLRSFGLFQINRKPFLFQKNNYTSYQIELALFSHLKQSMHEPIAKNIIEPNILWELEERGVLHYL